jgi:nitroreductase
VVTRCIDAALLAPNSSNLQTWQIHWVRSPETKAALVEACLSPPTAVTAQELFVFVARPDLWRENNTRMLDRLNADPKVPERGKQYYKVITKIAYNQGPLGLLKPFKWLWFTVRGLTKPTPREPIGLGHMRIWAHKSTALAAAHFMLALRARGIGSAWTTLHLVYEREAAAALGIPSDWTQAALIPLAYFTGTGFKPAPRAPARTKTSWNGWGRRRDTGEV